MFHQALKNFALVVSSR